MKTFYLQFFILLLILNLSCSHRTKIENQLVVLQKDTFNLINRQIKLEIDTNSKRKSFNQLNDSLIVFFETGFKNTPIILIHNSSNLYQKTLSTDDVLGLAEVAVFKREKTENNFDLRINKNRYRFNETNKYNFIDISLEGDSLYVRYSNLAHSYE